MSTIVRVDVDNSYFSAVRSTDLVTERSTPPKDTVRRYWISAKGAPEVLRDMFATVPDHYDHTYKHFAMNGSRVIALGWKWMTEAEMRADAEAKHKNHDHSTPLGKHGWHKEVSREKVEAQLQFAGFLVFHCPLKPDTASAIEELHQSMHRIVMITGDNPLTACHVARELTILRRSTLILDARADGRTTRCPGELRLATFANTSPAQVSRGRRWTSRHLFRSPSRSYSQSAFPPPSQNFSASMTFAQRDAH